MNFNQTKKYQSNLNNEDFLSKTLVFLNRLNILLLLKKSIKQKLIYYQFQKVKIHFVVIDKFMDKNLLLLLVHPLEMLSMEFIHFFGKKHKHNILNHFHFLYIHLQEPKKKNHQEPITFFYKDLLSYFSMVYSP